MNVEAASASASRAVSALVCAAWAAFSVETSWPFKIALWASMISFWESNNRFCLFEILICHPINATWSASKRTVPTLRS